MINLEEHQQELIDSGMKPFVRRMTSPYFIVFDFETNGLDIPKDEALSLSAFKCIINESKIEVIASFQRFYHPTVPFNPDATKWNGLIDAETIVVKRGATGYYPKHFVDDKKAFIDFCSGVDNFIGHNCIAFDCKYFTDDEIDFKNVFDTMLVNTGVTEYYYMKKYDKWHSPNLGETARFYEVEFNKDEAHASEYDCIKTYQIFEKMLNLTSIRMKSFDEEVFMRKKKEEVIF
jgi:DNA polymerase III epsilon subunit-like protein